MSGLAKFAAARSGVTLLEATIAVALTAAALTLAAQFTVASARAARSAEERQLAADEAANALERLFALSWDELTPDRAAEAALSEAAQARLHEGWIEASVVDEPAGEDASEVSLEVKRITVAVTWKNAAGEEVAPLRLTAWKPRRQGGSP